MKSEKNLKCKKCNSKIEQCYGTERNKELRDRHLCFSCNFWYSWAKRKNEPNIVRINHNHYYIEEETNESNDCKGHYGEKFVILFKDGRKVTTTNLWHQGEISKYFSADKTEEMISKRLDIHGSFGHEPM